MWFFIVLHAECVGGQIIIKKYTDLPWMIFHHHKKIHVNRFRIFWDIDGKRNGGVALDSPSLRSLTQLISTSIVRDVLCTFGSPCKINNIFPRSRAYIFFKSKLVESSLLINFKQTLFYNIISIFILLKFSHPLIFSVFLILRLFVPRWTLCDQPRPRYGNLDFFKKRYQNHIERTLKCHKSGPVYAEESIISSNERFSEDLLFQHQMGFVRFAEPKT